MNEKQLPKSRQLLHKLGCKVKFEIQVNENCMGHVYSKKYCSSGILLLTGYPSFSFAKLRKHRREGPENVKTQGGSRCDMFKRQCRGRGGTCGR